MTRETSFRSPDGLLLRGSVGYPLDATRGVAVLVHGGGVTREEGGFFGRLADGLATVGVGSLRFDLRGHGESEGRQEELTIAGVLNDIQAATDHVRQLFDCGPVHLIGTSFGGGISALFAARHPQEVKSLTLMNPLLNYKKRFIEDKPYWKNATIDESAGRELASRGFLEHSPTFRVGRGFLNELFYLQPHRALGDIVSPALLIHGTLDTFIPVESSRSAVGALKSEVKLLEIDGAQHGFAVHDDPQYRHPQTQEWQAYVVQSVADWTIRHT
ncbi:alpha/beta hydrolase [Streptomyces sp. NBC_01429]|uniref:alpha/beta hydrolase n=1 Tax=Streptomyces sp. NBC_01429 TaxID=2903862 RepID=UPI002E2E4F64|nr:alpha/beta fold hydrolase [Streptomyces sp. NBC_01429]